MKANLSSIISFLSVMVIVCLFLQPFTPDEYRSIVYIALSFPLLLAYSASIGFRFIGRRPTYPHLNIALLYFFSALLFLPVYGFTVYQLRHQLSPIPERLLDFLLLSNVLSPVVGLIASRGLVDVFLRDNLLSKSTLFLSLPIFFSIFLAQFRSVFASNINIHRFSSLYSSTQQVSLLLPLFPLFIFSIFAAFSKHESTSRKFSLIGVLLFATLSLISGSRTALFSFIIVSTIYCVSNAFRSIASQKSLLVSLRATLLVLFLLVFLAFLFSFFSHDSFLAINIKRVIDSLALVSDPSYLISKNNPTSFALSENLQLLLSHDFLFGSGLGTYSRINPNLDISLESSLIQGLLEYGFIFLFIWFSIFFFLVACIFRSPFLSPTFSFSFLALMMSITSFYSPVTSAYYTYTILLVCFFSSLRVRALAPPV
jgi:hypothetical protein